MKSIVKMMKKREEYGSLDFLGVENKPIIQKDGIKYEIISIDLIDDNTLELSVIPCCYFELQYLTVDSTWRKTSINHLKDIVRQRINVLKKYYEE